MPVTILTAANVMDLAAALLNDASKTVYTYIIQVPYLNMALQEFQEYYELNDVPVVDTVSAVMEIDVGVNHITYAPTPPLPNTPYMPDDLIEPQILWERARGTDPYVPMQRLDNLPRNMEGIEINQFIYYVWQDNELRFFPANADNDIKMDYIRNLFTPVAAASAATDLIFVANSGTFLEFRTAALCAEFCMENKSRADELNGFASLAMDRTVGIATKGRQTFTTRHRPFRSSYKQRTYM